MATQIGFDILHSSPDRELVSNELQDTSFFLAPSATVRIPPFSIFVESKWETPEISGGTRNNVFITPGLLWELPRLGQRLGRWRIGFGVRFGLADADDSFTFLTRIKLDIGLSSRSGWAGRCRTGTSPLAMAFMLRSANTTPRP